MSHHPRRLIRSILIEPYAVLANSPTAALNIALNSLGSRSCNKSPLDHMTLMCATALIHSYGRMLIGALARPRAKTSCEANCTTQAFCCALINTFCIYTK